MKSGSRGRLGRLLTIFGIAGLCLAAMHAPLAVAILGPLPSSFPAILLVMAVTGTPWAIVATLSALTALLLVSGSRLDYAGAALGGVTVVGYVGVVTLGAASLQASQLRTGSNQALYGLALALVVVTVAVSIIALVSANGTRGKSRSSAPAAEVSEQSTQQLLERQVASSLKLMGIGFGCGCRFQWRDGRARDAALLVGSPLLHLRRGQQSGAVPQSHPHARPERGPERSLFRAWQTHVRVAGGQPRGSRQERSHP